MATKSNFTARLPHLDYLRELVAGMGFTLTRGRGAGEVGSIQAFLNAMSSGEVVAFPLIADATDMMAVASRIDEIAAAEMDMTTDVLRYCTASLRSAAARVIELDAAEVGDESDAVRLVVNTAVIMRESEPSIDVRSVEESSRGPGILIWIPGYIDSDGTIIEAAPGNQS